MPDLAGSGCLKLFFLKPKGKFKKGNIHFNYLFFIYEVKTTNIHPILASQMQRFVFFSDLHGCKLIMLMVSMLGICCNLICWSD